MPVRFSLVKATSFRPWSKKSRISGSNTGSSSGFSRNLNGSNAEQFRPDSSGSGYLNRVPEEDLDQRNDDDDDDEEEELEEELEAQGLYRGSYLKLVTFYTLTPLTFVVAFTLLALLPGWAYPLEGNTPNFPSLLPYPLSELIVSAGLWALSHLLRTPVYTFSVLLCTSCKLSHYSFAIVLSTALHAVLSLLLRVIAIPILLIPHYLIYESPNWHDPAFRRVWWVALGWAAVEAIVSIKQGYDYLALYRDVLVDEAHKEEQFIDIEDGGGTKLGPVYSTTQFASPTEATAPFITGSSHDISPPDRDPVSTTAVQEDAERVPLLTRSLELPTANLDSSLDLQIDEDVEQLIAVRERDELEKYYGVPFIRIPVFISCLQRINSLLFSLGITFLLSSAYLRSTTTRTINPNDNLTAVYGKRSDFTYFAPLESFMWRWSLEITRGSNKALTIAVPLIFLVQLFLSLLHSQLVLPKAGVPTVVYIGSLVSLGLFFAGLGVWGALS
ncbi:hypothetical protein BDP27DRAFT_1448071 [Rhodocollybia butyracea]|uniref:Uncharacterized protein n=1 Tax=Rhodocollybia butyracea TaxID=206335 RepID=A0A9P5PRS5_9AGAR|nr:hypothetical protein BDP27DRAFT_1448071 [Rhodocollybia butyracea]